VIQAGVTRLAHKAVPRGSNRGKYAPADRCTVREWASTGQECTIVRTNAVETCALEKSALFFRTIVSRRVIVSRVRLAPFRMPAARSAQLDRVLCFGTFRVSLHSVRQCCNVDATNMRANAILTILRNGRYCRRAVNVSDISFIGSLDFSLSEDSGRSCMRAYLVNDFPLTPSGKQSGQRHVTNAISKMTWSRVYGCRRREDCERYTSRIPSGISRRSLTANEWTRSIIVIEDASREHFAREHPGYL